MINRQALRVILAAACFAATAVGCGMFHKSSGSSGGTPAPLPASPAAGGTPGGNGTLALLTPEQISNQLKSALNLTYTQTDSSGEVYDNVMRNYAVPLGGVDYARARQRDPIAKVQTLLVVRHLAFQAASDVVSHELNGTANPSLFDQCSLKADKPVTATGANAKAQASDQRWRAQVTSFYWRLYTRPPTSAEVDALASTFLTALANEKSPSSAWIITLYAMLSAAEFWNT